MIYTRRHLLIALMAVGAAATAAGAALPDPELYLPEDVQITGQELHSFTVDGASVSVVVGRFTMAIGGRRFSGRDAVLWVREDRLGGRVLRTIEAYIEGDATIREAAGTTTEDRAILVTVRQQGAFRASVGKRFTQPVMELPLYRRAAAMREGRPDPTVQAPAPQTPPGPPPTAAEAPGEPAPATRPATPPAPTRPVSVGYRADQTRVTQFADPDGRMRQNTICRGNVYITDGGQDLVPPIEIQADTAVLFTAEPTDQESADTDQFGGVLGQLSVTGAYLEGDVRISSGEHMVRGSRLYFDFVHRQAIILDAVYHTIQAQRNIPLYVRASEVRLLTHRTEGRPTQEIRFEDARISTSEFYTPTYHVGAASASLSDTTLRDSTGEALEEPRLDLRATHGTFNVRGVPVSYLPWLRTNFRENDVPIRRVQLGDHGRFGLGAETEWHLFRMLGLIEPDGFKSVFELDAYEKATGVGIDMEYARRDYTGLLLMYGVRDHNGFDDFGRDREDVPAPDLRGRWLWRHKQFLPNDWEIQAELSYMCDSRFLEAYYRNEFWAGKEQDTLIYARKQQDNRAFDARIQGQLNDFQQTSEAYPDMGFYWIGEPVAGDALTLFSESHVGVLRLVSADSEPSSRSTARVDTRLELDAPMHWGALNIVPYTFGRATYWSDAIDQTDLGRAIGGGGVKMNMSFWRVYNDVRSRLLDVHRLRHIITPEGTIVLMAGNVAADELHPFSPDIEQHLEAFSGVSVGIRQRWQTYRGPADQRRSVDLARLNIRGLLFTDTKDPGQPADGRFFSDRPEYSITRNALNGDFALNISDATAVLGDMNYDLSDHEIGLANLGVAVQRDPRFRYYVGTRYIDDLSSWVWTAGLNYKLSRKYEISAFQQYDMDFDGGTNLQSRVSLIRKLPRWYVALTFVVDRTSDDIGVVLTFWPEGMPEFRIGGSRVGTWAASELN